MKYCEKTMRAAEEGCLGERCQGNHRVMGIVDYGAVEVSTGGKCTVPEGGAGVGITEAPRSVFKGIF
ncbi:hypothetical protein E2C01_019902 [Portunus trituberculatus]|uniref:Uncharacterized protein n=1 Tax=Portunus trituberculatus TaxID=210409 RepID=A0A5B7DZW3_PORTR|nr:hypothetical protein [Portunus trituberculatus]